MKTRFHRSIILLLLAFSCGHLSAQNAAFSERFKQLNKHGDGKLTAGEAHPRFLGAREVLTTLCEI